MLAARRRTRFQPGSDQLRSWHAGRVFRRHSSATHDIGRHAHECSGRAVRTVRQRQARLLRMRVDELKSNDIDRYSLVMAGQVHIVTPSSGLPDKLNEVYIEGGRYGWLIAADTADVAAEGHVTDFPSDERTIIAQFPLKDNQAPAHSVLHDGPCTKEDYAGL